MEDGLSDFLRLAYEKGKVKEVKDAFVEYPVEKEWHNGKIENILCEIGKKLKSIKKVF